MNSTISFNPDGTSVQLGNVDGFSVFNITEEKEELMLVKFRKSIPASNVFICERLENSCYVAYASLDCQYRLFVTQIKDGCVIAHQDFPSKILSVRVNYDRLIVVLEKEIHICKPSLDPFHVIGKMSSNHRGIIDLTDAGLIAYPEFDEMGKVVIYDAVTFQRLKQFTAHLGRIAALKFDGKGDLLATASDKGTVIRVYSVHTAEHLFEFCRGTMRTADIYSFAFTEDSKYLATTSSTATVHVFKLDNSDEKEAAEEKETPAEGYLAPYVDYFWKQAEVYAPAALRPKSIASCSLSVSAEHRSACVFKEFRDQLHLLVATTEGYMFAYRFQHEPNPALNLLKQYRLGRTELDGEIVGDMIPFGSEN